MTWDPFQDKPEVVGDRYRLGASLGAGGAGVVHEAIDEETGETVAVKLVDAPALSVPKRFIAEARALHKLNHPLLVGVYGAGKTGGTYWYAMEHMPGGSLAQKVKAGGPLPVMEALRVGHQTCQALLYIHEQMLVHRDIKPGNVLFDAEGNAHLADFGIIKRMSDSLHSIHTRQGQALGTPNYRAPEQTLDSSTVDHRADFYGLAATMFYSMTSKRPPLLYAMEEQHRGAYLGDIPEPVRPIIIKGLGREREDRFPTARHMALAISEAASALEPGVSDSWDRELLPKRPRSWWESISQLFK